MRPLKPPADSNYLVRFFHLHCIVHLFQVLRSGLPSTSFSQARFSLFAPLRRLFNSHSTSNSLFKNILFTFRQDISAIMIITFIFASFNLLVPHLARTFLRSMKSQAPLRDSHFIQKFVFLQFLRVLFGEHAKRLSHELAVKIESTLSISIVEKSLKLAKECSDRIPKAEINQLENVDLKLIFTLFKGAFILFQAVFTIVVALIMLGLESPSYGFIALYWFCIAFFVQRELDSKMAACNRTKLGLINKRCLFNYEMLSKIRGAFISHRESLLVQRNNDLFIEECHDHTTYYNYSTLYDISLLFLPIFVVVTIALADAGDNKITIQDVYIMLTLMSVCYNPMKSFRSLVIAFHDGFHSLKRLQYFFGMPNEEVSQIKQRENGLELTICEDTVATYAYSFSKFQIKIASRIELKMGQRLNVIGQKGAGTSSFGAMLAGQLKLLHGRIIINGKLAYLPVKRFYTNASVRENIAFYNASVTDATIAPIYTQLGLNAGLEPIERLDTDMSDVERFTQSQLQKISLARIFCSKANLYILDKPYSNLSTKSAERVEQILRRKQREGNIIICCTDQLDHGKSSDKVLLLHEGVSLMYGTLEALLSTSPETISRFLSAKVVEGLELKKQQPMPQQSLLKSFSGPFISAANEQQTPFEKKSNRHFDFKKYLMAFLRAVSWKETAFVYLIIVVAELLHIFIHYFIGHEYEEKHGKDLSSFRKLLATQVLLTFMLAGIIYLQGAVSSCLIVAKGNNLYSRALENLTSLTLMDFRQEFSLKIADRFNHDFEELFVVEHQILAIFKNLIVLLATLGFIAKGGVRLGLLIGIVYVSLWVVLRRVEAQVVRHYYDFKYNFAKFIEDGVLGAQSFRIYQVQEQFLLKARMSYRRLAAYKLQQSYASIGQELVCDMVSTILLAVGLNYGIDMKLHKQSQAVIGTTIFLFMNLPEVLKSIVKMSIKLESYFVINMQPFMDLVLNKNLLPPAEENKSRVALSGPNSNKQTIQPKNVDSVRSNHSQLPYEIEFNHADLRFDVIGEKKEELSTIVNNSLNFRIQEGEKVLVLQENEIFRNQFVNSLTRNLSKFRKESAEGKQITIGGVPLCDFTSEDISSMVGVVEEDNFYLIGTLRANIAWRVKHFNEEEAIAFADDLKIGQDLLEFKTKKLDAHIGTVDTNLKSELSKKIALLRVLVLKPRIVIIKDTAAYVGETELVSKIRKHIPRCTILKLSFQIEASCDVDRLVLMRNLTIIEDGTKKTLLNNNSSTLGALLRACNKTIKSYLFVKCASVSPHKSFTSILSLPTF